MRTSKMRQRMLRAEHCRRAEAKNAGRDTRAPAARVDVGPDAAPETTAGEALVMALAEVAPAPEPEERVVILRCGGCGSLRDRRELVTFAAARESEIPFRIRLCASCRREPR